jgi:hypothetical protein
MLLMEDQGCFWVGSCKHSRQISIAFLFKLHDFFAISLPNAWIILHPAYTQVDYYESDMSWILKSHQVVIRWSHDCFLSRRAHAEA